VAGKKYGDSLFTLLALSMFMVDFLLQIAAALAGLQACRTKRAPVRLDRNLDTGHAETPRLHLPQETVLSRARRAAGQVRKS
jgi:hypothetical protein